MRKKMGFNIKIPFILRKKAPIPSNSAQTIKGCSQNGNEVPKKTQKENRNFLYILFPFNLKDEINPRPL